MMARSRIRGYCWGLLSLPFSIAYDYYDRGEEGWMLNYCCCLHPLSHGTMFRHFVSWWGGVDLVSGLSLSYFFLWNILTVMKRYEPLLPVVDNHNALNRLKRVDCSKSLKLHWEKVPMCGFFMEKRNLLFSAFLGWVYENLSTNEFGIFNHIIISLSRFMA